MVRPRAVLILLALSLAFTACEKKSGKPVDKKGTAGAVEDLDSKDILARTEVAPEALVKHVLIAWKDLASAYGGHIDPRAAKRTNAEAAALARQVADALRADPSSIDAQIKEHGEDPGAASGDPYTVDPGSNFVPEFKKLALRLKVGEVGIVKTQFGYHVMERVAPPPPDPLESADILARTAEAGPVTVLSILVQWKDVPVAARKPVDPRASARTKAEADTLAQEVLAKVRAGGDMIALIKQYSEEPGAKDNPRPFDVSADMQLPDPMKNLALRLQVGEAGLVKSMFGWHIMQRIPPPPPDPLESADILARDPVTDKAKVKHILLGWKDANAGDPRGKSRDRAAIEKAVKDTLARLKKGEKFEALMAELSEDGGSAKSGITYDVSPTARLVPPFKKLGLRLKVGEIGVVLTQFGFHIIERTE